LERLEAVLRSKIVTSRGNGGKGKTHVIAFAFHSLFLGLYCRIGQKADKLGYWNPIQPCSLKIE
jgi:hypothetical protein